MIKEIDALGNSTSYTYSPGGKLTSVLDGMGNRTEYGYDEFGKDTYGTQGQVQPFVYTGYRYDAVAGTYFAQAREYVPGVGRFGGEDWIKGSISYPTSLNAYGYCYGNPMEWVDRDGKQREVIYRGYIKESPYVGVFYLNAIGGALDNAHVAIMLVHENAKGDLYSFVGESGGIKYATAVCGYNDAHVNCGYRLDINKALVVKNNNGYSFNVSNRDGLPEEDFYNRAIYIPIDDNKGKLIAQEAEKTKFEVNNNYKDKKDYNLFTNNCDIEARKWLRAGGIKIYHDDMMPNVTYDNIAEDIRKGNIKNHENMKYGDLYDVWTKLHPECLSSY